MAPHTGHCMLYFTCHSTPVTLSQHLQDTRKLEDKKKAASVHKRMATSCGRLSHCNSGCLPLLVPPVTVDSSSNSDTNVCHRRSCLVPLSQQGCPTVGNCHGSLTLWTCLPAHSIPGYWGQGCGPCSQNMSVWRQYRLHFRRRRVLLMTVLLRNQSLTVNLGLNPEETGSGTNCL